MKRLVEDIVETLTQVYPEIPLSTGSCAFGSFLPTCEPIASFGTEEGALVFLALKEESFVLAEPKLEWTHPNIPEWNPQPRFIIPNSWQDGMTGEQRARLQKQAQVIAASRLAKYTNCVSCKERMAPEHLKDYEENGRLYCSECGNRELGVIH